MPITSPVYYLIVKQCIKNENKNVLQQDKLSSAEHGVYMSNPFAIDSIYNNFIVRCRIPDFHYHGNKRRSMANFSDTVIGMSSALKDPLFGARFSTISLL